MVKAADGFVLIPMGLHNTFRECPENVADEDRNSKAAVPPHMAILIGKLAKRNPQWAFIASGFHNNSSTSDRYLYNKYVIKDEDNTQLGWIDLEHKTAGTAYCFDGPRLRAKRTRGHQTSTVDLNKAYKTIVAHIYGKTLAERVEEAHGRANQTVHKVRSEANNKLVESRRHLLDPMERYALANWDDFGEFPVDAKASTARELYLDQREAAQVTEAISDARTHGSGQVVMLSSDKYHVRKSNAESGSLFATYTTGTVPENIKMCVGMLKLVEVDHYIPNIGTRCGKNVYFVMNQPKEAEE